MPIMATLTALKVMESVGYYSMVVDVVYYNTVGTDAIEDNSCCCFVYGLVPVMTPPVFLYRP